MSTNLFDIILLLIFALSVFLGFKKGFLKTLTGFLALVLSVFLATTLYPYATDYVMKAPVYDQVYSAVESAIAPEDTTQPISANRLNLPRDFVADLEAKADESAEMLAEKIASAAAEFAIKVFSMLSVFLIARLFLFFVSFLAGKIRRLPLIGWGDSLLGALFGVLRGLLLLYVILAFVTFAAFTSPGGAVSGTMKQSKFAKIMYHDNVLLDFTKTD